MNRVRCDNCGQESPFFEPGTDCTVDLTDGTPCPGKYRDPHAPDYTKAPLIDNTPMAPLDFKGVDPKKIAQLSSKSAEHYTPSEIVEVVRRTMGRIDLDPASCEKANTIVKAQRFYTKEDNGLSQPWDGFVYCNPPGGKVPGTGKSQAQAFFFKAVDEWKAERAKAVCFLGFTLELLRLTQARAPSACEFAFCVLRERTCFLDENLKPQEDPTHANVLILISHDKAMIRRFYAEAQSLGAVVVNADLVL